MGVTQVELWELLPTDGALEGETLGAGFGSEEHAAPLEALAGAGPQGEVDVEYWLEQIRGRREDNAHSALARTVKPASIDDIMADPLVVAAFEQEANLIHSAGQRVHGFAFEAAWCSALRRAGFNATLCRAASQADVAIAFEQPPPPDNVIGVQLKSNERHLKAQMAGKVPLDGTGWADGNKPVRIPHYASVEGPLGEYRDRMAGAYPEWDYDRAFARDQADERLLMAGAASYAATRHMQGYEAILYCETRFDGSEAIAFRLTTIDVTRMRGAMAAAMGYDLPEAALGGGCTVRPQRYQGAITSWVVDVDDGGEPPAPLFRARLYEGHMNIEQVSREGALAMEHPEILTRATAELGINDPDDVPPPIRGQRFDPLGNRIEAALRGDEWEPARGDQFPGHQIESDTDELGL